MRQSHLQLQNHMELSVSTIFMQLTMHLAAKGTTLRGTPRSAEAANM